MSLGQLLADMMPQTQDMRCPKCGGRLLVSTTVYVKSPVYAEKISGVVRIRRHNRIMETKKEMQEQIESLTDERDELYCENYNVGPHSPNGCNFWTTVAKLEGRE